GGDDDRSTEMGLGSDPSAAVIGPGRMDSPDPTVLADVRRHRFDLFEQSRPGPLRMSGEGLVHAQARACEPVVRGAVDIGPVEFEAVAPADQPQPPIRVPAVGGRQVHAEEPGLLDRPRSQSVAADLVTRETGLLEADDFVSGLSEVCAAGRSRRPGSLDDVLCVELHPRRARGSADSVSRVCAPGPAWVPPGFRAWWTAPVPPVRLRCFTWSTPAPRIWWAKASWFGQARIDS